MTRQEHKLKSMLNFYEVDLKGSKDEKMDKKEQKLFLDKFNNIMDYYILQDIISKIKEKREDKSSYDDEDEEIDPMLKPKDEKKPPKINIDDNDKLFDDDFNPGSFDNLNDPIDTDINKFLKWLTLVLYSGDHSVIITEDKNGIYIKLVKINKGKK
jgi:hypothetical protein